MEGLKQLLKNFFKEYYNEEVYNKLVSNTITYNNHSNTFDDFLKSIVQEDNVGGLIACAFDWYCDSSEDWYLISGEWHNYYYNIF